MFNSPCRITQIGGRSTFSPAIVSSLLENQNATLKYREQPSATNHSSLAQIVPA